MESKRSLESILSELRAEAGLSEGQELNSMLAMKLLVFAERKYDVGFSRRDFSSGRLRTAEELSRLILEKIR